MMMRLHRFNIYLCLVAAFALLAGCQSDKSETDPDTGKKKEKELTILELHMEVTSDGLHDNEPVPIFRADPMYVNISKFVFLDSRDLLEATLMEEQGGTFFIRVKFNARGTMLLDTYTTSNLNKRIAVFGKVFPNRWLSSPVIHRRITDGVFNFTPDATKEEAAKIVKGLNNAAEALKKEQKGFFNSDY